MRRRPWLLLCLLLACFLCAACAAEPEAAAEPASDAAAEPGLPAVEPRLIAIGHTRGPESALQQALQQADRWLRRESGGSLGFELYPDAQLGGDAELLSLVYAGLLPIALPRAAVWAEIERDAEDWPQWSADWQAAAVFDLPWLYDDAEQAVAAARALETAIAPYLGPEILRLDYFSAASHALVNSERALAAPGDAAGLVFASSRSMQELPVNRRLSAQTWQYRHYQIADALGAGQATAAAAPLAEIAGQGWAEHAPWLYLAGRQYEICAVAVNAAWYQELAEGERQLLAQALARMTQSMPALAEAEEAALLERLAAAGAFISRADAAAAAAFRAAMQPLYEDYSREYAELYAIASAAGG